MPPRRVRWKLRWRPLPPGPESELKTAMDSAMDFVFWGLPRSHWGASGGLQAGGFDAFFTARQFSQQFSVQFSLQFSLPFSLQSSVPLLDRILGSAHRVFTAVFGAVSGAVFGTPFGKRNWKKKKATPNSHNCSARACGMRNQLNFCTTKFLAQQAFIPEWLGG